MPMQPSPSAETSRLLFPSLRFCIVVLETSVVRFSCVQHMLWHEGYHHVR